MSNRRWVEKKVKAISEINDKAIKAAIDNPFASPVILANAFVMANIIKGESQFYDATSKITGVDMASKEGDKTTITVINGDQA
jgi:hypothetical protein